jgi:hypothetical protein
MFTVTTEKSIRSDLGREALRKELRKVTIAGMIA